MNKEDTNTLTPTTVDPNVNKALHEFQHSAYPNSPTKAEYFYAGWNAHASLTDIPPGEAPWEVNACIRELEYFTRTKLEQGYDGYQRESLERAQKGALKYLLKVGYMRTIPPKVVGP